MARVTVTAAAVRQIERRLTLKPLQRPVLAVWWSPGEKDVKRGPKGETIWETTEEMGWKVHLVDWSDMPDDDVMGPTEQLQGFEVWFQAHGREAIAEVIVDHSNQKYVVSERAI
jgi:hypothetical protein